MRFVNLTSAPVNDLRNYHCLFIETNHSQYNYARNSCAAQPAVDTCNATRGIESPKIFNC